MLSTTNITRALTAVSDFSGLALPTAASEPPLPVAPPPRAVDTLAPFDPRNPGTEALFRLEDSHRRGIVQRIDCLAPLIEPVGPATVIADIDRLRGGGIQRRYDALKVELERDFPGINVNRIESLQAVIGRSPDVRFTSGGREFRTTDPHVTYRLLSFFVCEHLLKVQSREGGELPRGCANAILNYFREDLYRNYENPEFLELKRQFELERRRAPRP